MDRAETIKDFKSFISANREKLQDVVVGIKDLPDDDDWLQDDEWDVIYKQGEKNMEKYNVGDVWWIHFPFSDKDEVKRRPAIVIDDKTIAILAMYVMTKNKEDNPYNILIEDWKSAGLPRESWTRIDKIVEISEWYMDCKIGELSDRDLVKILQLAKEASTKDYHEFTLIAIINTSGQYLQMYDNRWESWLFPFVRSTDNNKADVDTYVSEFLDEKVVTEYVACAKHCKYSISDGVYKIYNHKLYKLLLNSVPENMMEQSFVIDGVKYRWMSIQEMEKDARIMEVNEEVVAFVKSKFLVR